MPRSILITVARDTFVPRTFQSSNMNFFIATSSLWIGFFPHLRCCVTRECGGSCFDLSMALRPKGTARGGANNVLGLPRGGLLGSLLEFLLLGCFAVAREVVVDRCVWYCSRGIANSMAASMGKADSTAERNSSRCAEAMPSTLPSVTKCVRQGRPRGNWLCKWFKISELSNISTVQHNWLA